MLNLSAVVIAAILAPLLADDGPITVEGPVIDDSGILTYTVTSPYQRKANAVEVLLPDTMDANKRYPVIYILPVNDFVHGDWGRGIKEAQRHILPNVHQVICVRPEYDLTPYYGDNPNDPTVRQESYLIDVVIPLIDDRYPTIASKEGRFLLGFSKSGFGAVTILLRNLETIGKAAVWDAALMYSGPTDSEMKDVFGSQENFDGYYIPALIEKHAATLKNGPPRIALVSNGSKDRGAVVTVHGQLEALGIPHHFKVDGKKEHTWTSGWVPIAAELLFVDADGDPK